MTWKERLAMQLNEDRLALKAGGEGASEPFVAHQRERYGLEGGSLRLPEHFRGPVEQAEVCFLGPHVLLVPEESAPTIETGLDAYLAYYRERPEKRDPYGHYQAIMGGAPYLATELVHWPCEKDLAMQVLKSPRGPELVKNGLELTWAILRESPVHTLVLTGNDALKWVLPHLGWQGKVPTGVTQLHAKPLGEFDLPEAPGRRLSVVASFHWSPEMPLFVRKVPGLEGRPVREAISMARRMVGQAVGRNWPVGEESI